jgi:DNA-binding Xre family transcriptional regulator
MLATAFSTTYPLPPGGSVVGACVKDVAEQLRRRQRDWLRRIVADHAIKPTPLAKAAGVAATTLTRKLNDDDDTSILSDLTVARICAFLNIPAPNFHDDAPRGAPAGLREPDALPYEPGPDALTAELVALAMRQPGRLPWTLRSRALEYVGYWPSDVLVVDLNAEPRAGDVVCAQLYDWQRPGATQTVFRLYEPPYLLAAGPDEAARKPRLLDNGNVAVKGVVVASFRERAGRE